MKLLLPNQICPRRTGAYAFTFAEMCIALGIFSMVTAAMVAVQIFGLRIYTLDDQGRPHVIASKLEKEIGQPGTEAEKAAITDGKVYFGRGTGTVAVTLPLRDRNGDPMAAVRVQLKSFLGETQDTALTRATMIAKDIQAQVTSKEELMQ